MIAVVIDDKERRHENVTSNRARGSSAYNRHRNHGADFEHRRRRRGRTRQVVRGGRVPTEADTVRNVSWAVSCDGNASRSLNRRGRLAVLRLWRSAMRRLMKNWMNDDPWAIGILEPRCLVIATAMSRKMTC